MAVYKVIKTQLGGVELGNLENGVDPADTDAADTQHGNHHGDEGFSDAPECAGGYVHKTADPVGQTDDAEPEHAVADGFLGVGDVQGQQGRAEGVGQGTEYHTHHSGAAQADPQGTGYPLVLPGTGILTDEVDSCLMEGIQGNINEALNVAGGSIAGHKDIAKGVDRGLDQHIGNGEQRTLHTGRQTDP